jgi:hypothetical protein
MAKWVLQASEGTSEGNDVKTGDRHMGDKSMTRSEVLGRADQLINGDRARQYGSAQDNFGCIASMWSAYTGTRINAADVANMMALLKIARLRNGVHEDSSIDGCGYLALAHELSNEVG